MLFPASFWIGFLVFIFIALAMDLGVFNKKDTPISFKKAGLMTAFWFALSMLFCAFVYTQSDSTTALQYLAGYIVELSLSMDNVFVFIMIFAYFKIPAQFQHRVLFWGILGAIIMRFIMITGGIYLFNKFDWLFVIFGLFLIYTGYKIAVTDHENDDVKGQKNGMMKFLQKFFRVTDKLHGNKFWVKVSNKWSATPLFVVLIMIEKTDLIFALDSIPAVIAITREPFIVFTSNIFAILGLRSMYFLLASIMDMFAYLKYGISIILMFVGCKMLAAFYGLHMPIAISLFVIVSVLSGSIILSVIRAPQKKS
jgi:tellurite resistance protein TerC